MRLPRDLALVLAVSATALTSAATAQTSGSYWCEPLRAYYPRAANCPVPWRIVNPADPASRPAAAPWVPYATQYAPYDNYNHGNGP